MFVNSKQTLSKVIGDIRVMWDEHKYLRVTVTAGRDRSLQQNAISHAWYQQIADELREDSPLGVKRFCKLTIGVPILRAEDDEFRAGYDKVIRPLSYELKFDAMDILPVTSRMNTTQLSAYLETMQSRYLARGVVLEFPMDGDSARQAA